MTEPQSSNFWHSVALQALGQMTHLLTVSAAFGAILICAIVGPFTTYENDMFLSRLFFWTVVILASVVMSCTIHAFIEQRFAQKSFLIRSLLTTVIFSLSYTAALIWFIAQYYSTEGVPPLSILLATVVLVTFFVFLVSRAFEKAVAVKTLPASAPANPPAPTHATPHHTPPSALSVPNPTPPEFLKGAPLSALIRLSMRDHYMDVVTTQGVHLVHGRFSDALAALDPDIGQQVHRSHWIAFDHIKTTHRSGAKIEFEMSDGTRIPVSRSQRAALKARGLI